MENISVYIAWGAAIVIFGVVEAFTAQLVSVWFVAGSVAGLISAMCGAPLFWQFVIAISVTVIALVATRPIVKKITRPERQRTNADRCLGEQAVVTEKIDNTAFSGQAKTADAVWTARSADGSVIDIGEIVTVEKIEGVKLIVKQKQH